MIIYLRRKGEGVVIGNLTGSKRMANKTELREASAELQAAFDKINKIAAEHPSLMIYTKSIDPRDGKSKVEFGESFSSIVEMAEKRIDYFRRQLSKIEDIMPKGQRRKKNDGKNKNSL